MNEVRYAARSLIKSPGFTLAVLVTLALGLGSAAAIFSVVDRVLFRALPYPNPDQLVLIGYKSKRYDFLPAVNPIELAAYRERARSFSTFLALRRRSVNLVAGDEPMGVGAGAVPVDYFPNLGVLPLLGRNFAPGEDESGADHVALLTYRLWRDRFAGDPAVIDRPVLLAGEAYRIIGVLPKDFTPPAYQAGAQIYHPLVVRPDPARPLSMDFMYVIGRMRPGVTAEQAQAELGTFKFEVGAAYTSYFADRTPQLKTLARLTNAGGAQSHWTWLAAVGLLYLIACANAANLLLARVHNRRTELCIRLAIGAGRASLVRLVLAEALVLTLAAGVCGVLVAHWIFPALLWLAQGTGGAASITLDWRVIGFAAGLSVVTGVLVTLLPAWRIAQADVTAGLKSGGQTVGESRGFRRVRSVLVVAEAALATVLLVGAGLMMRTVTRLEHLDRGIDPEDKAALYMATPSRLLANGETRRTFLIALEDKLLRVPGVQAVSFASVVPLSNSSTSVNLRKPDGTEYLASWVAVSPAYRAMLGLPLVRGRWFEDIRPGDPPVAVLNETMAREWFGTKDPIGESFSGFGGRNALPWKVVGVARNIVESPRLTPRPQFYFPDWQMPQSGASQNSPMVLLRLNRAVDAAMNDAIRRAIFTIDPLIGTMPLQPLSQAASAQAARERYSLAVFRIVSALALGLAVLGLFAVMAYSVAQRMSEFGVRVALGAVPRQLFRLVLFRGTILIGSGIVIGCGAAWALTRLMQSLLYDTSPHDPLVYGVVALALLGAGLLGCWWPARRAMRVDVATLLRTE